MRVLVNATTLKSGLFQWAANFFPYVLNQPLANDWHFAVSKEIDRVIRLQINPPEDRWHVLEKSPARNWKSRGILSSLAKSIKPDCVYTFGGPAYVRFKAPHLLGCFQPWLTNPNSYASNTWHSWREKFFTKLRHRYLRSWFAQADAWISQTEAAKIGMHERLGYPLERITVVRNTCSRQYMKTAGRVAFPRPGQCIKALYFTAPYIHKALEMIPRTAAELKRRYPSLFVKFVLTLPPDHTITRRVFRLASELGVLDRIENRGPIQPADGPSLYRDCHFVFVPTLLEMFTMAYPEAMCMGLPIVTSNLDFATSVCGDAALYFEPNNAEAACNQIARLLDDTKQWSFLIESGKQRLQAFSDEREQFDLVTGALNRMLAAK